MDDHRFDQLTRAWAGIHTRRRLVGALVASTGAGALSGFGLRGRSFAQVTCAEGLTACDGVCVDTLTDVANCGGCGLLCPGDTASIACATGICVTLGCPTGFADCGDYCADTANDTDNCGACGNVCPGEPGTVSCVSGSCVENDGACPEGTTDCGGVCVDTGSDVDNCGGCGVICESGLVGVACVAGECVRETCPPALADCGDYCADTANDVENCGGCGNVCTSESGEVACIEGECIDAGCPSGLTTCGDFCVDLSSDLDNCGACGNVCASDLVAVDCVAGECVRVGCPPAQTDCGDFCADTGNDPENCGACGNLCPSGVCEDGVCVEPPEPTPIETPEEEPTETPTPTETPAALPATDGTATATRDQCPTTSEDENEEIARRWYEEAITLGDDDALAAILDPDIVVHAGTRPDLDGAAAVTQERDDLIASFPDVRVDVEQVITDDDLVVVRWTATGTQEGAFEGVAPTGRTISWTGIDINRIECGRIAEVWTEVDRRGQRQQLDTRGTLTPTP